MTLCTAFDGHTMIATGPLAQVAGAAKAAHDSGRAVLVFRDEDAQPVDLDLRGDLAAVLARLPPEPSQPEPEKRGPGRPKLGVTAREVTLLPRRSPCANWSKPPFARRRRRIGCVAAVRRPIAS